jgi:predicted permease
MMSRLRSLWRNLAHGDRVDRDLADEVRWTFDTLVEERMRTGMTEREARRAINMEIGHAESVAARVRDVRQGASWSAFRQDVRYAVRRLVRTPRFTIVAIVTLAFAVGANAAVFGVLNGVLLKPLPYPDADELIAVWHTAPGVNIENLNLGPSNYFLYRERSRVFEDVGLYRAGQATLTGAGDPEQVPALFITDGVLPILRVVPAAGRQFTAADATSGQPRTAMLGHGFWLRKFAGDPAVIGRVLEIDGQAREVIGILPRDFRFLHWSDRAVILPLQFDRGRTVLGQFNFNGIARLRPGVTLDQANADVARMLPLVRDAFPPPDGFPKTAFDEARIAPNLRPLKWNVIGDVGNLLSVIMGGLAIVFFIACANVANLWLVRLEGRRAELALRAALGAGRMRLAGELLAECLTIGAMSGLVGLGIAAAALQALVAFEPSGLPRLGDINVDLGVVLFTFAIALVGGLTVGAFPIVRYAGPHLVGSMREGSRTHSQTREQRRVRSALVVVQVALALVLLVASGLMIRTFLALSAVNPGFSTPEHVQVFRLALRDADPVRLVATERAILERLRAVPGVSAVGAATNVPMDGNSSNDPVFAQDRTYREGELAPIRRFRYILPGFFSAIGTPLVAGRDLTWRELDLRTPVALISQNFAVEYWGTPHAAVGKRIRVGVTDDWREIIGVAGDVYDDGVSRGPTSTVYWPVINERLTGSRGVDVQGNIAFVVRSPRAGTEALLQDLRRAVWSVNSGLPVFAERTLDEYYRQSLARTSLTLMLFGVAGGMALLLGVIGQYGVIAYSVSQRTREIGIRMALGAPPDRVTGMFVLHGLKLAVVGAAFGLAGAWMLVRLMDSLLYQVSAVDPATYLVVSVGLVGTCALAAYIPSRRAAIVDPVVALRAD